MIKEKKRRMTQNKAQLYNKTNNTKRKKGIKVHKIQQKFNQIKET